MKKFLLTTLAIIALIATAAIILPELLTKVIALYATVGLVSVIMAAVVYTQVADLID